MKLSFLVALAIAIANLDRRKLITFYSWLVEAFRDEIVRIFHWERQRMHSSWRESGCCRIAGSSQFAYDKGLEARKHPGKTLRTCTKDLAANSMETLTNVILYPILPGSFTSRNDEANCEITMRSTNILFSRQHHSSATKEPQFLLLFAKV